MFERILVATDGSSHSLRAAEAAVEMARLYSSTIIALYVVDIGKEYSPLGDLTSRSSGDMIARIRSNVRDQGEAATRSVAEMAEKAGIPAIRRIAEGYPAQDIIRIAEDEKASLIVMGGIGATGLERFFQGSVADKVVRSSKIPVLVVKDRKKQ